MAFTKPQPPIRVYVKVNSDFDSVGSVTPRAITWKDGRTMNTVSGVPRLKKGKKISRRVVIDPTADLDVIELSARNPAKIQARKED